MQFFTHGEMERTRVVLLLLVICKTALLSAQTTDSTLNQFNSSQYTIVLDPPDILKVNNRYCYLIFFIRQLSLISKFRSNAFEF